MFVFCPECTHTDTHMHFHITRNGKNPRMLVGCKTDLATPNRVDSADVAVVAEKLGAPHVETSAKGRTNIDAALSLLVREIRRRRFDPFFFSFVVVVVVVVAFLSLVVG